MKKTFAMALAACACVSFAGESEVASEPCRWTLTVGPAWRARVKSSISGGAPVPAVPASHTMTYDKDVAGHGAWGVGEVEKVQDPDYPTDPSYQKYAATRTATETTVTPYGSWAALGDSEIDRPLGVKANVGYDFYAGECFSFGLNAKLAAYWNMRTSASGYAGGGTIDVRTTTDYYFFSNGPIPDDADFASFYPDATPYQPYRRSEDLPTEQIAGSVVSARIRSDLYQLGLGPQATWHALGWIDVYGRVEALCNLAHMEFDVGTTGGTDTKCLLGFGGTLGCAAYVTECLGLYAEAGYEWIDKAETDFGRACAGVDYSSFVLSIGAVYRF